MYPIAKRAAIGALTLASSFAAELIIPAKIPPVCTHQLSRERAFCCAKGTSYRTGEARSPVQRTARCDRIGLSSRARPRQALGHSAGSPALPIGNRSMRTQDDESGMNRRQALNLFCHVVSRS